MKEQQKSTFPHFPPPSFMPFSKENVKTQMSKMGFNDEVIATEPEPEPKTKKQPKPITVGLNEFFKNPVPESILENIDIRTKQIQNDKDAIPDFFDMITSPPTIPGVPRPLWTVVSASLPTGLIWYGYYKFCVEEELMQMEIDAGKEPRGFGGYGTLAPFTYGMILGPICEFLDLPGGNNWMTFGIIFIYYTQFLLYDRVNELYEEEGLFEPPLTVWWCWPVFFPFNLIVGLRQVHFLSQYFYRQRGIFQEDIPKDPLAQFFPFIGADKFTWQEFLTKPSLWFSFLKGQPDIDVKTLPDWAQQFLALGTEDFNSFAPSFPTKTTTRTTTAPFFTTAKDAETLEGKSDEEKDGKDGKE